MKKLILAFLLTLMFNWQNSAQTNNNQEAVTNAKPIEVALQNGKAKAYFASGCFGV